MRLSDVIIYGNSIVSVLGAKKQLTIYNYRFSTQDIIVILTFEFLRLTAKIA